jgi:hypothetical protein
MAKTTANQITMEAEAEVRQPAPIKVKVVLEMEVPFSYLQQIEGNTTYIRTQLNEIAEGLQGSVLAVDIV